MPDSLSSGGFKVYVDIAMSIKLGFVDVGFQ
jgi:hypothetical protein